MGLFPPELRDKNDLWSWARRLGNYLRSTVLRSGRGILLAQTDSGTTVSLGNHSADHTPGGKDEVKFQTLEITFTNPNNPEDTKRIIFNPAWDDFLADRIFSVNAAGTFTGWRTLTDLVDGLTGFSAGKVLTVNEDEDGLEFTDGVPENLAYESTETPFEAGKLVIASSTAHELLGTVFGINLAGGTYNGYYDNALSTDARVAQIADARIALAGGWDNEASGTVTGTGIAGRPAIWDGTSNITYPTDTTAAFPKYLRKNSDGEWVMEDIEDSDLFPAEEYGEMAVWGATHNNRLFRSGKEFADLVTAAGAAEGDILYHNGSEWVLLSAPDADKVLQNTADGVLSWEELTGVPSGSLGAVLYHNGTSWVALEKPTSTKVLLNDAAGNVGWGALPAAGINGGGLSGQIAVFEDETTLGSQTLKHMLDAEFGAQEEAQFLVSNSTGFVLNNLNSMLSVQTGYGAKKALCVNAIANGMEFKNIISPDALPATKGQMLYYDGTVWKFLNAPGGCGSLCIDNLGNIGWTLRNYFNNPNYTGSIAYWTNSSSGWEPLAPPYTPGYLYIGGYGTTPVWKSITDFLPSGSVGQILYHNGTSWVGLAAPSGTMILQNSNGSLSWITAPTATVQSSGGLGASLVTSTGKIKTIYGD